MKIFKTKNLLKIPFNKDQSVGMRHTVNKKGLKFAPGVELAKLNFTYIYHSTKIV